MPIITKLFFPIRRIPLSVRIKFTALLLFETSQNQAHRVQLSTRPIDQKGGKITPTNKQKSTTLSRNLKSSQIIKPKKTDLQNRRNHLPYLLFQHSQFEEKYQSYLLKTIFKTYCIAMSCFQISVASSEFVGKFCYFGGTC